MNNILLIKPKIFWFGVLFILLISCLFVFSNRVSYGDMEVVIPDGDTLHIVNPFTSEIDGKSGVYIYNLKIVNSPLFSGILHVIPDDCIETITINNETIPLYKLCETGCEDNCDDNNGLYLNFGNYLTSGSNNISFEVMNNQGLYGLQIIDETFYEKYCLLTALLFVTAFLNWKKVCQKLSPRLNVLIRYYKVLCMVLGGISFLYLLSVFFFKIDDLFIWCSIIFMVSLVLTFVTYRIWKDFLYRNTIYLFLVSSIMCILYLVVTPYYSYSYDVQGHLDYIKYVTERDQIPIASGGWVFYHPSLYYICCTTLYHLLSFLHYVDFTGFIKIFQTFSLCSYIIYCYFSLRLIDLFFKILKIGKNIDLHIFRIVYFSIIGLFLLWPSNTITSIRIGNDSMFSLFFVMGFYYSLVWLKKSNIRYLVLSLLIASLCVWAKTNGFVLFGIVGIFVFMRLLFHHRQVNKIQITPIYVFFLIFSLTVYFSFKDKIITVQSSENSKLIVGNVDRIGDGLNVGTGLYNFIVLNPIEFVKIPFTSSSELDKGRDFFWFYLFKTSMFGEFTFHSHNSILSAKILSFMLLLLITIFLFGFNTWWDKEIFPFTVALVVLIIAMIVFRIYYPYSSSNDFRYIYPALLPFTVLTCSSLVSFREINKYFIIMIVIIWGFIFTSVLFQVANFFMLYNNNIMNV